MQIPAGTRKIDFRYTRNPGLAVWIAGLLLAAATPVFGQLPQARLYAVYPAGGQRGTAVDAATLTGADLDDAHALYFSHPGITAAPKTNVVNGQPQPVPGQFVVTIAGDVPVGIYDVRAIGRFGISNPRSFAVGDRPEIRETEPNNTPDKANVLALNSVVEGRSDGAADIDYYKISGSAGQRILADCQARRIDSRMNASLEIRSATGRKLAYSHRQFRQDPLLDFTLPAAGDYYLVVSDFVYGGGAEFFYRLTVHTGPHVDFVVPASGVPGSTGEFTLFGRNLPGGTPTALRIGGHVLDQLKVQITLPTDGSQLQFGELAGPAEAGSDGTPYTFVSPAGTANPVMIYFAASPTAIEQEPNDSGATAQKVAVPAEITGQFQARGDVDVYSFEAKSGDVYWIEAYGQRTGSAADPYLVVDQLVRDDKGVETVKRLTAVDDTATNIGGLQFNTTTDDPQFRFVAPADGTFRVELRDRYFESRGDPGLTYRLAIRKESPDFRLAAVTHAPTADQNQQQSTWELGLRKGDAAALNVMAFRRDGFNGPIDVTAEGLPAGVTCTGVVIGPGQSAANLVVSSTEQAPDWFGSIRIVGKARLEDPAQVKAVTDADTALKAAVAALPALDKAAVEAAAAAKTAAEKAVAAKEQFDKDPNNDGLKKALADAEAASAKAAAAAKTAADAKVAGDQKAAAAAAQLTASREARDKSAREIVRNARAGTIVWNGVPGQAMAAKSRVARSVVLAVLHEPAPFQLVTDVARADANPGRQILVPVKLIKRSGFDNNVNLTFVAPPANVQVENKPINKGATAEVYRIFLPNNAPIGEYTLLLQGQTQVAYVRNPELVALTAAEKTAAEQADAAAAAVAKTANDAKTAADQKANAAAEAAKKSVEAKTAADKAAADSDTAAKAAATEKAAADKAAIDADAAAKAAADEKTKADAAATAAEIAQKAAAEKAAAAKIEADKAPDNKALADAKAGADKAAQDAADLTKKAVEAKTAADKKVADTADAAKKAVEGKTAADKKAADTADAAKKAQDAKAAADKLASDAATAAKVAADEKAAADKVAADAAQKAKDAAAAKAAAEKRATETANANKPQNLNTQVPVTAIRLTIKQAPGSIAVTVPNNGALKRGGNIEVKVKLTRANGFLGPATLSLPLPPGVAGLSAAEVTIPADKDEGTLVVQAAGEATLGQLANMVVRASMQFDGPAAIDQPLSINVSQ